MGDAVIKTPQALSPEVTPGITPTSSRQQAAAQALPHLRQLTAPLLILQESTTPQSPLATSMLAPSQDPAFHAGAGKPLALLVMAPQPTLTRLPL